MEKKKKASAKPSIKKRNYRDKQSIFSPQISVENHCRTTKGQHLGEHAYTAAERTASKRCGAVFSAGVRSERVSHPLSFWSVLVSVFCVPSESKPGPSFSFVYHGCHRLRDTASPHTCGAVGIRHLRANNFPRFWSQLQFCDKIKHILASHML